MPSGTAACECLPLYHAVFVRDPFLPIKQLVKELLLSVSFCFSLLPSEIPQLRQRERNLPVFFDTCRGCVPSIKPDCVQSIEGSVMPRTKQAAQAKRRSKVVLAFGAAGLSLSLGSSASAAIGGMNEASSAPVSKQMHEEEISDVSLATFHVFDSENAGSHEQRARLAMGVGGCAGCGGCGCACGIGLYYHYTPPVLGDPVDPPPFRPIRPAHKSKSNRTR